MELCQPAQIAIHKFNRRHPHYNYLNQASQKCIEESSFRNAYKSEILEASISEQNDSKY